MARPRLAILALFAAWPALPAQSGITMSGALQLALPTGGRAVAMGQAAVADPGGTEAIWWNPALLAWSTKRELAIHFNKTLASDDNAIAFLLPVGAIGSVTASSRLFDYGSQDVVPFGSDVAVGTFSIRGWIWAMTFAAPIGDHIGVGLNYKYYQFQMSCASGDCSSAALFSASTSAIDVGLHYRLGPKVPWSFAAVVQNVGPAVQFRDEPQRDPLPAQLSVGASLAPNIPALGPDAGVHVDAALISRLKGGGTPGFRLGGEISWQHHLQGRAGYVLYGPDGRSGPSIGFGFNTGRIQVDVARVFNDISSQAGQVPTYVSLRFNF